MKNDLGLITKTLYFAPKKKLLPPLALGILMRSYSILRKMVPDACKPLDLVGLHDLMENPVTRKALLDAEVITYPALLLLRNQYVGLI